MAAEGDSKQPPAKTECIHPGKDPKCGDCPDREVEPPVIAEKAAKDAKNKVYSSWK